MSKVEINILMGLPGSGKSTWRKRKEYEYGIHTAYHCGCSFDCDDYLITPDDVYTYGKYNTVGEVVSRNLDIDDKYEFICIDGLNTTNEQIQELISIINIKVNKNPYLQYRKEELRIIIHHWREDRESCLFNDAYRRDKSCKNSIMNLPLEDPKDYTFDSDIKIKIEYHDVERKNVYEGIMEPMSSYKREGYLYSDTWCSGGDWADCWGNRGDCWTDDPVEFKEFDNLIERLCPNITFLQYKRIHSDCVTLETDYDYDYYGGCQHNSYYVCDMKKLYEMIKELGYITEEV
jgi:hypothetical protein